jgi:hypothetical protein
MTKLKTSYKTGGSFLVEPATEAIVFSREDFTEEHRDIWGMVKEFDKERILSQKEAIEKYDKDLFPFPYQGRLGRNLGPSRN